MHFNSILPDTFPIVTEIPSTVENQTNQGTSQTLGNGLDTGGFFIWNHVSWKAEMHRLNLNWKKMYSTKG